MLTPLTSDLGFWIVIATALINLGSYKLMTKQNTTANGENSKQIRQLSEKVDTVGFDIKLEQGKIQSDLQHMNEKINRIESDTAATRLQSGFFSEAIAKIQVKMQSMEKRVGERFEDD